LSEAISPTFYEQLFAPIPFCQKITNPNSKNIKSLQNTFVQKSAKINARVVYSINILQAVFLPMSFSQKIQIQTESKLNLSKTLFYKKSWS